MRDSADMGAQEQLLAELGWVAALAHRLVADPNVADDVLQRVCLVALERPPRDVSGRQGIRRWLSTLTRRTAAHSRRSAQRRAGRERVAARDEALPATVDLAERREVLHQLVDALSDLQPDDRMVLTRRYFDGLDIAEIADQLELSESTLRQRLSRARRRLRELLERKAGPDRERWLAALAPAASIPATPDLFTASRAELAREAAQTALSSPTGVLIMAKTTGTLALKVAAGLVIVTAAVATTWKALDTPAPTVVPGPGVVRSVAAPDPEPAPLPVLDKQPVADPLAASSLDIEEPAPLPVTAEAVTGPSSLALALDQATASYVTDEPDLQALNEALRQLAHAARVIPDSVARDPTDGSVSGWLDIEGTGLKAEWGLDADGRYSVDLDLEPGADFPEGFQARSLGLAFQDEGGHATHIGTTVQFHPDTSEDGPSTGMVLKAGEEQHVGWHLDVSEHGTIGSPITMQEQRHKNSVLITAHGGQPSLSESWANDTSPYDSWLALLRSQLP